MPNRCQSGSTHGLPIWLVADPVVRPVVAHVITGLHTGGAEMMLYKLVSQMQAGPFQPVVISLGNGGALRSRIERTGTPVFELGMPRGRPTLKGLARLRTLMRELHPALIQGWMYHGNVAAFLARRFVLGQVPVVWNIRQSLDDMPFDKAATVAIIRLGALLSRRIDQIVYNSVRSVEQHQAIGYSAGNTVVIANGFDTDLFRPSSEARASLRRELKLPGDTMLIGQVGRFHPMKGHENLLQAASLVALRHPKAFYVLVGSGLTQDNSAITSVVNRTGLRNNVFLLGERSDVQELMAGLDVACLASSSNEGFPNVIGEAMACGIPNVVTDVGDARRIVGDTGLVVPPGDCQSLADALIAILDMRAGDRVAMGLKARRRVVEHYALRRIALDYQNLYRSFVGEAAEPVC